MSASRFFLMFLVLLGACALVAGCGNDLVAPTEDEAPILPPENVSAVTSNVQKLVITWDASSHPQLKGYNVYRMDIEAQELAKLTSVPILNTNYQDMGARRGVQYEYRVTAITKANKESMYTSVTIQLQADQTVNLRRGQQ